MTDRATTASEVKSCCAALYASDWARLLLGDSFHPGGRALTERLGQMLGLHASSRVLDVASGRGASALVLARTFSCQVVGVDFSAESVGAATELAAREGLTDRVQFLEGDAEQLPSDDCAFDAVICECAFCTFPDKAAAAIELARVLRPGGAVGLADLTRNATLPVELQSLLAWISCLGDARPIEEYVGYLTNGGFSNFLIERRDDALRDLVRDIRAKLLGAELLAKLGQLSLPAGNLEQARNLAKSAALAVENGQLGYSLIVGYRS